MSDLRQIRKNNELFPWDFYLIAKEFIKKNTVFLNHSGEFAAKLLSNRYPPHILKVISGISSDEKQALTNSGAKFYDSLEEAEDNSFNLITCSLTPYDLNTAKQKLKKGGHIIAEELGFETVRSVLELLNTDIPIKNFSESNNLENKTEKLKKEGFKTVFRKQCYVDIKLGKDEFTAYFNDLSDIYPELKAGQKLINCLDVAEFSITEHRFIYTAKLI